MLSNRFAVAALATACIVAAGAGGYLASRQNATTPVSVAVVSHDPLVQHWATGLKTTRVRPTASIFSAAPVDRQRWFPLPPQYEEPASSGLTLLLSKGANQLDITLP